MHYHLEVIMPPTDDISAALDTIMGPFDENNEESAHPFWDFYVIGGRWAGEKDSCRYDPDKLQTFYDRLHEAGVTVSGFQAGKQRLEPESQIPMVDGVWNELFPTETGEIIPCPVFAHSNDQYDSNDLLACDICRVDEIPDNLMAARVIIAVPRFKEEGVRAEFMICDEEWNGINFMKTVWDGKVKSAITMFEESLARYRGEYAECVRPRPDWICVTVDYHS